MRSGEAAAIMTGAAVPAGADAVVMVEFTTSSGDQVEVRKSVAPGDNVVPHGAEAKRGDAPFYGFAAYRHFAKCGSAALRRKQALVAKIMPPASDRRRHAVPDPPATRRSRATKPP